MKYGGFDECHISDNNDQSQLVFSSVVKSCMDGKLSDKITKGYDPFVCLVEDLMI